MKYRIIAAVILSVLALNLGASTLADTRAKKASGMELVALLPASDGVVIFDVKRSLGEGLPKILASNQPMLAKVLGHIDEFQEKTGIDIGQFDDVAVGFTARQLVAKKYDVDGVIIARGQTPAASLIEGSKRTFKGKFREEQVGARTIYVFEVNAATAQAAANLKVLSELKELAVASIDDKTIAFGEAARVRQTLEGKTRVGSDLTGMLNQNPTAVASFASRPPAGLKAFLPLQDDELGRNIDAIRYIYGNANLVGDSAVIHATARTVRAAEATSLYETAESLRGLGKGLLSGSKGEDKKAYARLLENTKFTVKANELTMDLAIPQSDIDILVAGWK